MRLERQNMTIEAKTTQATGLWLEKYRSFLSPELSIPLEMNTRCQVFQGNCRGLQLNGVEPL